MRHYLTGHIQIWDHFFYQKILIFLLIILLYQYIIIDIFQLHCKSEYNQVKWNKIQQDNGRSDSIFLYLQSVTLLEWLLKFVFWEDFSKKWIITVPEEKCPSFNFIP